MFHSPRLTAKAGRFFFFFFFLIYQLDIYRIYKGCIDTNSIKNAHVDNNMYNSLKKIKIYNVTIIF